MFKRYSNRTLKSILVTFSLMVLSSTLSLANNDRNYTIDTGIASVDIRKAKSWNDSRTLRFSANGQSYTVQLAPNSGLQLPANAEARKDISLFKGHLAGVNNSWVRVSYNGNHYQGVIFDGKRLLVLDKAKQLRNLAKASTYSDNQTLLVDAKQLNAGASCSSKHNPESQGFDLNALTRELKSAPDVVNAINASKQIDVVVVVDTEYTAKSGGDPIGQAMSQINIVDGIFSEQVGVKLNITELRKLNDNGSLTATNANTLLTAFRNYSASNISNMGIEHLLSGKNLDGSVAGIAYVGTICGSYSVGLSEAGGGGTRGALIMAHELGHNFGAPHDNQANSACKSTPGGFLMNPTLSGSSKFSNCSLEKIGAKVARSSCVSEVAPTDPPQFKSIGNLKATANLPYAYDSNSQVDLIGSGPITVSLDRAPEGMTMTGNGIINWTPTQQQIGIHSVRIRAKNSLGEDFQSFDITVSNETISLVNFNDNPPQAHIGEDRTGSVNVSDDGLRLQMTGNRWQVIPFAYTVTPNTVLEFDFSSSVEGEIHAIGFDTNNTVTHGQAADRKRGFQVYGSQNWGIDSLSYSANGSTQRFIIPVGTFYTGNMKFLFFTNDHDVTNPSAVSNFSNIRVYERGGEQKPAKITSTANTSANVGKAYQYDANGQIEATGTGTINFNLNSGPEGMSVSSNGTVSWTPNANQTGTHNVQITATNALGSDTQNFSVTVVAVSEQPNNLVNFAESLPQPHIGQDVQGTVNILNSGKGLELVGNTWQVIPLPYQVTPNTVIEFEFKSTAKGELHGIGFDTNNRAESIDKNRFFKLYGTQSWGFSNYTYTNEGLVQRFVIPVGTFYTGNMNYLFFVNDHDVANPNAVSRFSNIRVYEQNDEPQQPAKITSTANTTVQVGEAYQYDGDNKLDASGTGTISFELQTGPSGMSVTSDGSISWTPGVAQAGSHQVNIVARNSFGSDAQTFTINVAQAPNPPGPIINFAESLPKPHIGQDVQGTVNILNSGKGLELVGNTWQVIPLPYQVTPNTVIEFEFKSTAKGELHGIGFDTNNRAESIDKNRFFKLYGTQSWGFSNYTYTNEGLVQRFVIPVGTFYTGNMNYLFFVNDHDVANPNAVSTFSNIRVYERQ